jgi:transmembrane sensor
VIEATHKAVDVSATEIESRAAAWFRRRHFWSWSESDQAELDLWLGQSLAHRVAYWRLQGAWERTGKLTVLRPTASEQDPARGKISSAAAKIASVLAVVVIAAAAATAFYIFGSSEKTYATGLGGHETVRLADGSQIELNTDTQLRIDNSPRDRIISLDKGEAFFEVKHDSAHPFVVLAGNRTVTDLGTKFLIRRDTDRLQVAVMEGRVRLENADRSHPKLLQQGDVMVAEAGRTVMLNRSSRELANDLGWRRGLLVFSHTTLAAAADEFNRYNREKLVVADDATARLKLDGTFRTNDMKQFTEVAQAVFGLRVENRGDQTVISR